MKFIAVLIVFLSTSTLAQSPTEVASQYFNDVSKGNIYELGKYYHPEAKIEFRSLMSFLNEAELETQEALVAEIFGAGRKPYHLKLMSDEEFLSSFLEFVYNTQKSIDKISIGKSSALGEVFEGNDMAYVVIKTKGLVGSYEVEAFDVMPFKRDKGSWKALLNTKTKTAAMSMSAVVNPI